MTALTSETVNDVVLSLMCFSLHVLIMLHLRCDDYVLSPKPNLRENLNPQRSVVDVSIYVSN